VLSDTRRNSAEAVTWPVRVAASWSWRLLIVTAAVYVLVRVSASVGLVIFAVIIALFLTAVLHPLEQQFRRLIPRPRSLPPLLALLTGVAVLGAIGYLVAWQISSHTIKVSWSAAQSAPSARSAKHSPACCWCCW
jgi:predicted PurR-regulated permease PerM